MTDQQINAAIAEACGWTNVSARHRSGRCPGADELYVGHEFLPNYCTDLNAMHEALKTLQPDQLWDVAYSLPMETMLGFMATARELAETFLMVIGKWEPTTEESSADHLRDGTKMMGGAK